MLNCVRATIEFDSMFRMSVGTSLRRGGLSEGEKDVREDGCRMVIG